MLQKHPVLKEVLKTLGLVAMCGAAAYAGGRVAQGSNGRAYQYGVEDGYDDGYEDGFEKGAGLERANPGVVPLPPTA